MLYMVFVQQKVVLAYPLCCFFKKDVDITIFFPDNKSVWTEVIELVEF